MKRTTVALVAVVAFFGIASLAACGGDDSAAPSSTTEETGTETATDSVTETHGDETETHDESDLEGDAVAGKSIFVTNCASCHTLGEAGTTGTIGPNLDDSKPSTELVIDRVTHGRGVMPPFEDTLSEQEIADAAAYVAETAGS
ncbi:MAG: cytochrome c [Actinobacteria bacterium]|nr:cytochrome c [Actinomycetota bacterium]